MTCKLKQKCTSVMACCAVCVLFLIIVVIWLQFGHNNYKKKLDNNNNNKTNNEQVEFYQKYTTIIIPTTITTTAIKGTTINGEKDLPHRTYLEGLHHNTEIELIKPMKIGPPPLHEHDIIYNQMHNYHGKLASNHHTGHFRHRQAELWDPHPHYEIIAFGHKLQLELRHNDDFVWPDLHTMFLSNSYVERVRHDPKLSKCFYTGKIHGDDNSQVSVSLCNGMTGYIRTSHDNYYIEPAQAIPNNITLISSFLHRIMKIPHLSTNKKELNGNNVVNSMEFDQCETNENHTIIDDDFDMNNNKNRKRRKREILFDEMNTEIIENHTQYLLASDDEILRTPRDTDWASSSFNDPIDINIDNNINNNNNDNQLNNEYFIKVLVVADKTMLDYHQRTEDLQHYILTLMSHVALLYKDASIGHAISISVVNIWILGNQSFPNSNSQEMLKSFCDWQRDSPTDRLHDTALLLTRDTICRNAPVKECKTLGAAEIASMCNPSSSCAIVKDNGLATTYTIAHEFGHILSMPHDDDKRCLQFHNGHNQNNIMMKMMQSDTKPWSWSDCSRYFLTEFLSSSRANCLYKHPRQDYITPKFSHILPGERFEANKQCELQNGVPYVQCTFMPTCENLWCMDSRKPNGPCVTQYLPTADGTPCEPGKRCYRRQCIYFNKELLVPINGGWGPWQRWGECSRTCGGGIKISKRYCDAPKPENGGNYCVGRNVRYASCNTQDCGKNVQDFREIQCENAKKRHLHLINKDKKWIPKYGFDKSELQCKLYCRALDSNEYLLLADKVIDGTKCGLNSFDICVNGNCLSGGCDNQLNSNISLDDCGVCGGDNSKCLRMTGRYNTSSLGYRKVVRIPKGSSNLDIRQYSHNSNSDENYLALLDGESGEYILNGNSVISVHQKNIIFGAVSINYTGAHAAVERITTPKIHKLTKDLVLQVLSVGFIRLPNITYQYIIDQQNSPRYGWLLYETKWSKCNSICSGTKQMSSICVDLATNKEQPESYCANYEKQIQKQDCNTHCQLVWNIINYGPCSVHCGKGVRNIHYNCVKISTSNNKKENSQITDNNSSVSTNGDRGEIVDNKHCNVLPKSPNFETCYGRCESTRWDYSEWSHCTVSCGGGTQRRTARCVDNNNQIIDDSHCENSEKIIEQVCKTNKCPIWSSDEWTPCSVSCGRGYRTKPYYCHLGGRIYKPTDCDPTTRPIDKEECNEHPCTEWITSEWSECSVSCGDGIRKRDVICKLTDDINKMMEDRFCYGLVKPNNTKHCNLMSCIEMLPPTYARRYKNNFDNAIDDNSINPHYDRFPSIGSTTFKWITGPWSHCSKSCDGGISSRIVVCRNDLGEANYNNCDQLIRPIPTIKCNQFACPNWNFGDWSECDSNCERHRQVSCQNSTGSFVDDNQCDKSNKPPNSTKCKLTQCSKFTKLNAKETNRERHYHWKPGKWKECSNFCGKGFRRRNINCENKLNSFVVVDAFCNHLLKPKTSKPCERYSCSYTWIESHWSPCSVSCGEGIKLRNVTCHKVHQGGIIDPKPLPDLLSNPLHHKKYCDLYNKPSTESTCLLSNCNDNFIWRTGNWKECSQHCGRKGRQMRQIYCMNVRTGQRVHKRYCPLNLKPPRKRKCNQNRCLYKTCKEIQHFTKSRINKDYLILINGRPALIYCYKMDTREPEEYISLSGDSLNYSEMYDKRLKNIKTCPSNDQRRENCINNNDCIQIGPERSGLTKFWKIRLNITSMIIINNDYTFSQQLKGMKVPYGTAGDCYSMVNGCIQGRFSINLIGTTFRLSRNVKWRDVGNFAKSQIDFMEYGVVGRCGGYCGSCIPDSSIGLQVEIT